MPAVQTRRLAAVESSLQRVHPIPQTFRIVMGLALCHDWQLMPQEPLDLIQVYPGLYILVTNVWRSS